MLRRIDSRVHNNFARDAALHGYKIPLRSVDKTTDVPDNNLDDAKAMEALEQAQKRVRARYGR